VFYNNKEEFETFGTVFNIENYHVNDGTGIRTNIFIKGCNLWCPWCCNPESQAFNCQIAVHKNICLKCGKCTKGVCPQDAIAFGAKGCPIVDCKKCVACGACLEACQNEALELYGKVMSVSEVINEAVKDIEFFSKSGGGITISGGEPCMQPDFTRGILIAAKRWYINTAVETAGVVAFDQLWNVLEFADDILFDLKFTDAEKFKTICREPLDLIRNNIAGLRERGKRVVLRCPIIPSINDDDIHIDGIISWAKELDINDVDILPFHQLGKYKYDSLEYDYTLGYLKDLDKDKAICIRDHISAAGLNAVVGG